MNEKVRLIGDMSLCQDCPYAHRGPDIESACLARSLHELMELFNTNLIDLNTLFLLLSNNSVLTEYVYPDAEFKTVGFNPPTDTVRLTCAKPSGQLMDPHGVATLKFSE